MIEDIPHHDGISAAMPLQNERPRSHSLPAGKSIWATSNWNHFRYVHFSFGNCYSGSSCIDYSMRQWQHKSSTNTYLPKLRCIVQNATAASEENVHCQYHQLVAEPEALAKKNPHTRAERWDFSSLIASPYQILLQPQCHSLAVKSRLQHRGCKNECGRGSTNQ